MSISEQKSGRILFCVLNWGLGHATRSIPIIRLLQTKGYNVTLASDGRAQALLMAEFPEIPVLSIPSYGVRYTFKSMFLNLLYQWPIILIAMIRERLAVKKLARNNNYDAIISDNRYGCFDRKTTSVCITHQINPMTSFWLTDKFGRWISLFLLSNFDIVWIPDDPKRGCLAGPMVLKPPHHSKFIGFLSRFTDNRNRDSSLKTIDIVIILSGPEPLRTHFEKRVLNQMAEFDGSWVLVRGRTEGNTTEQQVSTNGRIFDFLTSSDLEELITSAKLVVSRSGYTSLMDYLILGTKALVVPTPGQYEQEYLAEHIPRNMPFVSTNEEEMDILGCFNKLDEIPSCPPYINPDLNGALEFLSS